MIYFIQAGDGGPIKIGFSATPRKRIVHIQTHCPERLTVLAITEGTPEREAYLHGRFAHLRRVGEWFSPGADLLSFIADLGYVPAATERKRKRLPGPLGAYLHEHSLTLEVFATRLDISGAQLSRIISAPGFLPSLATAHAIEVETQGQVPMQYWCQPEAKAKARAA